MSLRAVRFDHLVEASVLNPDANPVVEPGRMHTDATRGSALLLAQ
jgi:hypothetical protein